jgi:hypothetical protein
MNESHFYLIQQTHLKEEKKKEKQRIMQYEKVMKIKKSKDAHIK